MPLRVYNTLTRQKEEFQTVQPGKVGMYVCGPTVYKPSHVGHMVGPVIFDTVKRYLTYLGYEVTCVVNITDVDDKLIVARQRAEHDGQGAGRAHDGRLPRLPARSSNVTGIDHMPQATEHIAEMIDIMQRPDRQGLRLPGRRRRLFRRHARTHDYGKLCNRDPEQLEAGARIEVSDKKRNPGDFALWKGAKPGEPAWDSPVGAGPAGLAHRVLGHEHEVPRRDARHPRRRPRPAVPAPRERAGPVGVVHRPDLRALLDAQRPAEDGHAKMAGSVGNVVNVVDLLKQHSPETVRFLLLGTHYRSPIE